MKPNEKKCPRCAEVIKADALICKHCGYEFSAEEIAEQKSRLEKNRRKGTIGCLVLLAIILFGVVTCSLGSGESEQEQQKRVASEKEDVRKGFNCLSQWDGSNRSFVDQIKETLRDPDTFEHIETKITPADDKGDHMLTMKYRAANGFGGKNVVSSFGVVHADCSAEVSMAGVEEGR